MATAIFGQPETAGSDPVMLEHATLIYRAIHTLEHLRDNGDVDEDSVSAIFAEQSWRDLRRLLRWYYEQGVRPAEIDIGDFV